MEFVKKLEFGNYTLKFGDSVLLDYIDEIVMPSFFEMKYVRKIEDKSDFFFLNTEMVVLDADPENPVIGIQGRIVKDTLLIREQRFEENKIVPDHHEMESAPSSFFLLILNTHRLILCKEVSGAPTIENFQATSQFCLNQKYNEYIDELFNKAKEIKKKKPKTPRVTKKSLRAEIPAPKLRITTLTDTQSLEDFVELFEKINTLSIKLLPTNDEEIDNDDFWSALGDRREDLNSNQASVRFSNPEEGLNSHAVLEQLNSATGLANSQFNLKGLNDEGDIIKGSNDDFALLCEVDDFPTDTNEAAETSYEKFSELVADGRINLPQKENGRLRAIIVDLYQRFA